MLQSMRDEGMPPVVRHEHWLRTAGVATEDRSVYEREAVCRVIDSMVTVDQPNVVRRLQLVEEAPRISSGSPDHSAAGQFMGRNFRRHGAMVALALSEHAAANVEDGAMVAEGLRKAREEAKLGKSKGRNGGPAEGVKSAQG